MKALLKKYCPGLTWAARWSYDLLNRYRSRPSYVLAHAPFLASYHFDLVFFDNRGNHPTQHLARTRRFTKIKGATILSLGCRRGDEVDLWLGESPGKVIASDYFAMPREWDVVQKRWPSRRLHFLAADARRLPFPDNSFDIITSEALLEHVNPMGSCMYEMWRLIKPGGLVYANFGPLYHTYGGAHYEGAYEHLLMSRAQFYAYIANRNISREQEECRFYFDNDMFSYWTIDQYLDAIIGFEIVFSIVFVSRDGRAFRRAHPEQWQQLRRIKSEKDLLVSGLALWLRKPLS
jgi:ubiquinone/menaquinone biosynthesis C-methylase UbiE